MFIVDTLLSPSENLFKAQLGCGNWHYQSHLVLLEDQDTHVEGQWLYCLVDLSIDVLFSST